MKKRILSMLLAVLMVVSGFVYTAKAGDDYPNEYKNKVVVDRWNFYTSQCTSFAAWCLNSRNGVGFHNHMGGRQWGHAKDWGHTARALGYTVDKNPTVGSIAWWDTGQYGHVAWVSSVNGSTVTIEEYNYAYSLAYHSRNIDRNNPTGYIHIKDLQTQNTPPAQDGDDYPDKYRNGDPRPDEWNFYSRYGTSFAAWRLNSRNGVPFHNRFRGVLWGHSKNWVNAARSLGYVVDKNPAVGSIAYWTSGQYGNVAWVSEVSGSSVTVEEYSNVNFLAYSRRTVDRNNPEGYIHIKDLGPSIPALPSNYSTIDNGVYVMKSKLDENKFISMDPNNQGAGSNVMILDNSRTANQWWRFERHSDGSYKVINEQTGKVLDVHNYQMNNGVNIFTWDSHENDNQRFYLVRNSDNTYTLYAKHSGLVVDVAGGVSRSGTNIQQWELNGSDAQKFYLEAADKYKAKPKHKVTFKDYNDKVLETQEVEEGSSATAPKDPSRKGYEFTGWDKEFTNVRADLVIKARYSKEKEKVKFTVTFKDYNGKVLAKEKVEEGSFATPPLNPTRKGYEFTGWKGDYSKVKSDKVIYAEYKKVDEEKQEFTVTFKNYDETILEVQKVGKGSSAVPPANPVREGYEFIGWSKEFDKVESDLVIYAQYNEKQQESETASDEMIPHVKVKTKGRYSVVLSEEEIEDFLEDLEKEEGETVFKIALREVKKPFNKLTIKLSRESVGDIIEEGIEELNFKFDEHEFRMDLECLKEIYDKSNDGTISFVLKKVSKKNLSKKTKKAMGKSVLYTLDIKSGKKRFKKIKKGNIYVDNLFTKLSKKEKGKHLIWFK